jgi:energy-converting hydrogenase Eha subunit C
LADIYLICSLANKHYLKVADLAALGTTYFCGKVADACLQEIILHRPLHQMVVNRAPADIYLICSLANKHYLKVADLAALESDYYKAINNYER